MNVKNIQPAEARPYTLKQRAGVLALLSAASLGLALAGLPLLVLVESARATLGISDVQVGLLLGAFFSIPALVMSLLAGWLCDRASRRLILFVSLSVAFVGAIICATAPDFQAMALGRIVLGLASGATTPLAMTWINDAFPSAQRGRAVGGFFMMVGIGPSLTVALAGYLQAALQTGFLASLLEQAGFAEAWRGTLLALATPILVLAPLTFLLPDHRTEVVGGGMRDGARPRMATPLIAMTLFVAGVALIAMFDAANLNWMPTIFMRRFGFDAASAGLAFALITLVAGVFGPLIGGWLGDLAYAKFGTNGRVWLAAGAAFLCAPLFSTYGFGEPNLVFAALTLGGVCTVTAISLAFVTAQSLLPPDQHGLGVGVISAATSLLGAVGPVLVASVSNHMAPSGASLPQSLMLVVVVAAPISGVLLLQAVRPPRAGFAPELNA